MFLCAHLLLVLWIAMHGFALADEPRRAIDDAGIQRFIESHRTEQNGPGKILASSGGYYDGDSYPDKLVIYTYEHGPNRGNKAFGMFAVAFLTENFSTTDILFIPESEMVWETLRQYSSDGKTLTISGERRLPGDAMCCPSAITSITVTVEGDQVVVLKGEYRRKPAAD